MKNEVFFSTIRKTLFKRLSQSQVDGINGILQAMNQVGDGDKDTLAYALATAYHETGSKMVPVREGFASTDLGARRAVNNLAKKRGPNSAVARYAQPTGPYGHVYYGRGHVQLTWLDNYKNSSADAGVDLVKDPDAMLDPVISAKVLIKGLMDGRWSGKRKGLSYYEGSDDFLDQQEARAARQTVNGFDKASLIGSYHKIFYDALTTAGWQSTKAPIPIKAVVNEVITKSSSNKVVAVGGIAAVIATVASLWEYIKEWASFLYLLF
jgi:Chitinase class I